MDKIIKNFKHLPSTSLGIILAIIAGLVQVPGFDKLCSLSPTAGAVISYLAGVASLILMLAVGKTTNSTNKTIQ